MPERVRTDVESAGHPPEGGPDRGVPPGGPDRESGPPAPGRHPLLPFAYLLALFAGWMLVEGVAAAVFGAAEGGLNEAVAALFSPSGLAFPIPFAVDLLVLGVTLAVSLLFSGGGLRGLPELGLAPVRRWPAHLGLGVALESAHLGVLFGAGLLAGLYRVAGCRPLDEALAVGGAALLLALPLAASEEIVFRGCLMRWIEESHGRTGALLLTSALFAVIHLANPGGTRLLPILGLFAAGIYLGAARLASGGLWLPIAMHTAWNAIEGPILGLPVSGSPAPVSAVTVEVTGPELWTGGDFGPEAGLPVLFTTAVFTLVVWKLGAALAREAPAAAEGSGGREP